MVLANNPVSIQGKMTVQDGDNYYDKNGDNDHVYSSFKSPQMNIGNPAPFDPMDPESVPPEFTPATINIGRLRGPIIISSYEKCLGPDDLGTLRMNGDAFQYCDGAAWRTFVYEP